MPCGKRIGFEDPGHTTSFVLPLRRSALPASAAGFCGPPAWSPWSRESRWFSIPGCASCFSVWRSGLPAGRLARLAEAARKILLEPNSATAAMSAINAEMISASLRGIAVENGAGGVVRTFGDAGETPSVTAPPAGGLELVWDGELIMRVRNELSRNGAPIGSIVIEQSTGSLGKALFDAGNLGATGEVAVCVQQKAELWCFPGSRHRLPFTVAASAGGGRSLPMQLALAGRTGDVVAVDYRGQNMIAAYGSLATGLAS